MLDRYLQLFATFWPMIISGLFGTAQAYGLKRGAPWAYRLGIPVAHLRETLPLIVPDEVPETTESEPVVIRLERGRIGFLARGSQLSTSASASGVGGAAGSGQLCFGVIELIFGARETTFVYRGCVALYALIAWMGLVLQAVVFTTQAPYSASAEGDRIFILATAVMFGLFIGIFTMVKVRQLVTGYHVLSADLARRGAQPPALDSAARASGS